jgi:hypothetical protein
MWKSKQERRVKMIKFVRMKWGKRNAFRNTKEYYGRTYL